MGQAGEEGLGVRARRGVRGWGSASQAGGEDTRRRISLRTGRVRKISVDGKGVLKRKQMFAVRARDPAAPHPAPSHAIAPLRTALHHAR